MKKIVLGLLLSIASVTFYGQSLGEKIKAASLQLTQLDIQKKQVAELLEAYKLEKIQADLIQIGLPAVRPGEQLIQHAAYTLSYVEKYEQARWVAHIISPDILNGVITRTNDFRADSLVSTGSADEADYFTKIKKADGSFSYDAFGYDRGHLAPSADFRWSKTALSESYFYSNMSPQVADFNRGGWGDLEDAIRAYVYTHPGSQLYVVTGPLLNDSLLRIERGIHKVAIPKQFWKVALDLESKKAIGFLMPNIAIEKPLASYAVDIKTIEAITNLDFFNKLPVALQEVLENQHDATYWLPEKNLADAEPMSQELMPRNYFNSIIAKNYVNKNDEIHVCGTVVGARISKAGNVLINLDKQFPNQVFTVFVKKEDIVNFNFNLIEVMKGKTICVKGKVLNTNGTPTMYVSSQTELIIQEAK
ncbi:MAG: DNA/RNA non-specific endonuclease [Ferruginibacter sp.]